MLNNVSELDISGCKFGECELQELKQYSKQHNFCFAKLTKLNATNTRITSKAANDMTNILSHATRLNSLHLSNSSL